MGTRSGPFATELVATTARTVGTKHVVRTLPSASGSVFTELTLVGLGAVTIDRVVDSVGEDVEGDRAVRTDLGPVPETETAGRWELPAENVEIALPSGVTWERQGTHRGYGLDYVEATTSLTQA